MKFQRFIGLLPIHDDGPEGQYMPRLGRDSGLLRGLLAPITLYEVQFSMDSLFE